jgi:hypothetical protein
MTKLMATSNDKTDGNKRSKRVPLLLLLNLVLAVPADSGVAPTCYTDFTETDPLGEFCEDETVGDDFGGDDN